MRRCIFAITIIIFLTLLVILPAAAQTAAKKPVPKVPVIYDGDTEDTIRRRAQWIEGARQEGNVLTWWGIIKPPEAQPELIEFNKLYPSIKVEYWVGTGEEIATKLEMEFGARRRTVDVAYGAEDINLPRWREKGLMEKFVHLIPGIEKWDKRSYNSAGDSALAGSSAITPQYNTKLVSPAEAPRRWEDLLNPKWKGQISMPTDPKNWWTMALADGGWGVEKTRDFLTKLKTQQVNIQTSLNQGHTLLVAGDFKIFTNGYLRHVMLSQEKSAPVDWCRVDPVTILGPSIIMPSAGPHPNTARLFLEWYLSPAGAAVHEKVTGYGSAFPGSGSRLAEILKGRTFTVRTEEVLLKAIEMDLDKKFSELIVGVK